MDPLSVAMMQETEVARIASETDESRAAREELETKLKVLKSGTEICKLFAALFVAGQTSILNYQNAR